MERHRAKVTHLCNGGKKRISHWSAKAMVIRVVAKARDCLPLETADKQLWYTSPLRPETERREWTLVSDTKSALVTFQCSIRRASWRKGAAEVTAKQTFNTCYLCIHHTRLSYQGFWVKSGFQWYRLVAHINVKQLHNSILDLYSRYSMYTVKMVIIAKQTLKGLRKDYPVSWTNT